MDTLNHSMMSLNWFYSKGFDEDLIDALLGWTMMPDVAQAVHGKHVRTITHMEEEILQLGETQGQLHKQRVKDFYRIFSSPIVPILKPPYGCAARNGVLIHYMQDQLYDEWLRAFVKQRKNEDGTHSYYARFGNKDPLTHGDVLNLKKWSWKEGTRYIFETSKHLPAGGSLATSTQWNTEHILRRLEKNPYWHPAMSSYALMYHDISLSGPDTFPAAFSVVEKDLVDGFYYAIDNWHYLVEGNTTMQGAEVEELELILPTVR